MAINNKDTELKKLQDGARAIGVELDDPMAEQMFLYLDILLAKNKKLNLTAIRKREDAIEKHLIDSLSVLPIIDRIPPSSDTSMFDGQVSQRATGAAPKGAILDVGSGGGLPGLPLKCARPDIKVTLVEAKAKKVHFLKETIQKLGMKGIRAYHHYLDPECPVDFLGRYDWIVTRATMPIRDFLRNAILYKKENGALILMKGPDVGQELEENSNQIQRLGLKLDQCISFELPFSKAGRTLIILR